MVSFQRDGKHLIVLKCPSLAARDTESILRSVKGLVPNCAWVEPSGRPSVGRNLKDAGICLTIFEMGAEGVKGVAHRVTHL